LPRQKTRARAIAVSAGVALGVLLCEALARAYCAVEGARRAEAWRRAGATHHEGDGPVEVGHLIRPHAERRISYELIPNLDLEFKGAAVRTNADGFRGPACPRERAPGTLRIVGIGDSVLFGWGVEYEQCFAALLEQLLEEDHPGVDVQFVNTGVPGYNTVMQVETLKAKGLAYQPDLVLVDFVVNDLQPPHFIPHEVDYLSLSRSFLAELAAGRRPFQRFGPPPRLGSGTDFWAINEFDPERVPAGLEDMVGLASFRRAMDELAELSVRHGFEVIVSTHVDAPEYLRETCAELGFPLIETGPRLAEYMEAHGLERRVDGLQLSDTDPHPTALAHRMQAEEIRARIAAEGLVQRILEAAE
jgi:hypothetical protein